MIEKFCHDCKKNSISPYCPVKKQKYTGEYELTTKLRLNRDGQCKYYELKTHKSIILIVKGKLKLLIIRLKGWLK